MRYLIIADSHGDENAIRDLKPILETVDGVIHLGDHVADLMWLQKNNSLDFYGVRGNCDGPKSAKDEEIITIDGIKILMTHGHLYGVKHDLADIYHHAHKKKCSVVLFGHTHIAVNKSIDGIVLHNPGSLSLPKDGAPKSYSILTILDGMPRFEHFYVY